MCHGYLCCCVITLHSVLQLWQPCHLISMTAMTSSLSCSLLNPQSLANRHNQYIICWMNKQLSISFHRNKSVTGQSPKCWDNNPPERIKVKYKYFNKRNKANLMVVQCQQNDSSPHHQCYKWVNLHQGDAAAHSNSHIKLTHIKEVLHNSSEQGLKNQTGLSFASV